MSTLKKNKCPICGKDNNCALLKEENIDKCWCNNHRYKRVELDSLDNYNGCYCKDCLESFIDNKEIGSQGES